MDSANTETHTIAAIPTATTTKDSSARRIILIALVIHFFSLFLPYQDATTEGDLPIMWNTGDIVHLQNTISEQTGFHLLPYAGFVIIGLFLIFMSKYSTLPFWQRFGYWISLVLIIVFAFGGAVIRTSGGRLSLLSVGLIILAAYLNAKQRRRQQPV